MALGIRDHSGQNCVVKLRSTPAPKTYVTEIDLECSIDWSLIDSDKTMSVELEVSPQIFGLSMTNVDQESISLEV